MLPTEAEGQSCTRQRANGKFGSGELMEIQEVRVGRGGHEPRGLARGDDRPAAGEVTWKVRSFPSEDMARAPQMQTARSNRLQPPSPTRYGVLDSVLRTSTSSVP